MADQTQKPPLGSVAQDFENKLQSAEQTAFYGSGTGEPAPVDDFAEELKLIVNGFVRSIMGLIEKHQRR